MIRQISLRISIGLVVTALSLCGADMLSGTWKLNLAKSKYSPGPAPKSLTVTITREGAWVVAKSESIGADSKAATYTNRYTLDGKPHPYKTSLVDGTISVKRIDDFNSEATIKSGKSSVTAKGTISKDGKTRTLSSTGTNAEGKAVNNVAVYDKQ
jgi:hypothetical protein